MTDEERGSGAGGAPDPADVLAAVVTAIRSTGTDMLGVLRPLLAPGGDVEDFEVVADSHLLAQLAGGPVVGRRVREAMPADLAARIVALSGEAHRTGVISRGDLLTGSGGEVTVVPDRGGDHPHRVGEVTPIPSEGYVVLVGRDVTEARGARRALLGSEQRYRRLVEHSRDPILVTTAGGVVTYASPAVRAVLHTAPDDLVGGPVAAIAHPADARACADLLRDVVAAPTGEGRTARLRTRRPPSGGVGWVSVTATNWSDDAAVGGVVLNVRDVTEQRAVEERLQQEALQDPLTGLPNRRWFGRALREAVSRSDRTGAPFGVLVLDVDDFKRVNDTLGHPAGDALLADLAGRLTAGLRPSDTAARLGGDEFVVIAEDLHSAADALTVARRVRERCAGAYRLAGVDDAVRVTVSIGLATSTDVDVRRTAGPGASRGGRADAGPDGPGADLFRRADAALYRAKRLGRDRIELAGGPGAPPGPPASAAPHPPQ